MNNDSDNLKPVLNFDSIDDEIQKTKNYKKSERIEHQPTNIAFLTVIKYSKFLWLIRISNLTFSNSASHFLKQ